MTKRRPERIALVVGKGCLRPADDLAKAKLRAKGFEIGELIFAEIRKVRNPRFHRLTHALGKMVADNIDAFEGMDPHAVLKRLQLECGIGCEEVAYKLHGMTVVQRIPLSLSFESMEESEFRQAFSGMCHHLGKTYWHGLSEQQVADMVELMPKEVV